MEMLEVMQAHRMSLSSLLEGFSALSLGGASPRGPGPIWTEEGIKQEEALALGNGKQEQGQQDDDDMEGEESDSSHTLWDETSGSEDLDMDHSWQYFDGIEPKLATATTQPGMAENEATGNGTHEDATHENGTRENQARDNTIRENEAPENRSQGNEAPENRSHQVYETIQSPVEGEEAAASSPEDLPIDDDSDEFDLIPTPKHWTETLVMPQETPSP
ncbi:hypothetical protein F5144DRAFT_157426 [Chaetomium tenue]|uniref:Uncharacterized protein n=1 Tax=Chaetomium tenue TaxID=1854479 RepID=A0ACB7P9R7_9PEZI|nr:hypothetical protein F5144DRAFT_157426 [Chaetomium globosum]